MWLPGSRPTLPMRTTPRCDWRLKESPWCSSQPASLRRTSCAMKYRSLVWDSAIAAGWWRCASETPQNIFPERVGHYWVWRDDRTDWHRLFHDETEEWVVRLPVISKAGVAPNLGARLDAACDSAMISHQEQGARIGIGRSTYFEVKAGRGGKKARRRAEEYLRSLQIPQKPG